MEGVERTVISAQTGLVPSHLPVEGPLVSSDSLLPLSGRDLADAERSQSAACPAFLQSAGLSVPDLNRLAPDSFPSPGVDVGGVSQALGVARVRPPSPAAAGQSFLGACTGKGLTSDSTQTVGSFGRGFSNSNLSSVVGPPFGEQEFPPLSPALGCAASVKVSSLGFSTVASASRGAAPSAGLPSVIPSPQAACSDSGPPAHSWSKVVGEVSSPDRSLSFFPPIPSDGDVIIKPPVDLLRKGNRLWSSSLIGGFLNSRLPFKKVESFAFRAWGRSGLQKVYLHDKGYFIFRFQSAQARDNVMASGPWYVGNKLLLLQRWKEGSNLFHEALNKIPVWVRLFNVPYAYWTPEGLSYVASGIGKPLFMDSVTAKLEPMPFARICIEITAGAKLPDKVLATVLDVDSGEETLIPVTVEYQNKPQVCGVCSSFGHSHLKCPRANFQWVSKPAIPSSSATSGMDTPIAGSPQAPPTRDSPMALPKRDSPTAPPKRDSPMAPPMRVPLQAPPKRDSPMAPPKGMATESFPKGVPSTSLPKGIPPIPRDGSQAALPKGPLVSRPGSPKLSPSGLAPKAIPPSPNPFVVLAQDREDDREEDRATESSEDDPPSWGPLVRRIKAIDEKEKRALLSADIGPPLRVQAKNRKKKKSPKGK